MLPLLNQPIPAQLLGIYLGFTFWAGIHPSAAVRRSVRIDRLEAAGPAGVMWRSPLPSARTSVAFGFAVASAEASHPHNAFCARHIWAKASTSASSFCTSSIQVSSCGGFKCEKQASGRERPGGIVGSARRCCSTQSCKRHGQASLSTKHRRNIATRKTNPQECNVPTCVSNCLSTRAG